MTCLKLGLARAAMALAFFGISPPAGANTESDMINKGDLGVSLYDAGMNGDGKGDCDCAESLYGGSAAVNGFHRGYGEDFQTVVITPAAAPAMEDTAGAPVAKTKPMRLKRLAMQEGGIAARRKAGRAAACVFGAPNASGCNQN